MKTKLLKKIRKRFLYRVGPTPEAYDIKKKESFTRPSAFHLLAAMLIRMGEDGLFEELTTRYNIRKFKR